MGDTFLFSLGGTFLIIFHQYLYGWSFLILSWVAFSYGWHFHGALNYYFCYLFFHTKKPLALPPTVYTCLSVPTWFNDVLFCTCNNYVNLSYTFTRSLFTYLQFVFCCWLQNEIQKHILLLF